MGAPGLRGVVRGTTVGGATASRPVDLVAHWFRADAPNGLWVSGLTSVRTPNGWSVAFVVEVVSRLVVGWQASYSLPADLALDAMAMAS